MKEPFQRPLSDARLGEGARKMKKEHIGYYIAMIFIVVIFGIFAVLFVKEHDNPVVAAHDAGGRKIIGSVD